MVEIRLDGERLLKHLLGIEAHLNEIRRMSAMGSAPAQKTYEELEAQAKKEFERVMAPAPSVQGIDLTKIEWKGKGSVPASTGDPWAWAFAYEQDGSYKPESETLVKTIERDGGVTMDGYKMTLGGRDKRLLNRKNLKKE